MVYDIENKIKNIIKDILGDQANLDLLNSEERLEHIGLNSISFIRVTIAIEKEFGFQFDDERLNINAFDNVGSIAEYVESKINSDVQENT